MNSVLQDVLPEIEIAVHVVSMGIRLMNEPGTASPTARIDLLEDLRDRNVSDDVVERIRLGLLAADDEANLLRHVPGGIEAHTELAKEDTKGRFLLMTIAKWLSSEAEEPAIWEDLTFAFLDAAGRAFGLASALASQNVPDWSSKVA
ncbi:hypothetical protein ENSA7_14800 [Enhygromyxa salina]|uniref:Uncharacterized protein n=2 Tax=Enhygromyxa salina TaxID=215803 RepID=A0A2S9YUS6_9BACT|nr:hypothetical protein ENSA7_14800 [Enhygromyxa salina]